MAKKHEKTAATSQHSYEIGFENVVVFDTDNAAYMKKDFGSVRSGLFPNSVHCTCLAHIINLVGESFRIPFCQFPIRRKNAFALFYYRLL